MHVLIYVVQVKYGILHPSHLPQYFQIVKQIITTYIYNILIYSVHLSPSTFSDKLAVVQVQVLAPDIIINYWHC